MKNFHFWYKQHPDLNTGKKILNQPMRRMSQLHCDEKKVSNIANMGTNVVQLSYGFEW